MLFQKKKYQKIILKKIKTLVFFNYVPQLMTFILVPATFSRKFGEKQKGFMPVISNAPKDHHSLMQLYLDGPKDKFFYVFSSKTE